MSEDRDVVARALRGLAVPEHGPGFWEALEARLAAEDAPRRAVGGIRAGGGVDGVRSADTGDEADPAAVVSLDCARVRRGAGRRRLMGIAAVAAALFVAVGLVRSATQDSERLHTAGRDPSATAPEDLPATAAGATAEDAVVEWFEALGGSDLTAAANLMGPRSRRYLEALRLPVDGYLRDSGEGYGGWVRSPDRKITRFDVPGDAAETIAIVVVSGTWTGEGETEHRTDAIPVARADEGRWLVEPVAIDPVRGGRLEMISPGPGENGLSGTTPDAVLEAGASGAGTFFFSIDDGPLTRVEGRPNAGGVRGSFDPPGEMPSRTHPLLVAYVDGDTIAAFAATFLVEG